MALSMSKLVKLLGQVKVWQMYVPRVSSRPSIAQWQPGETPTEFTKFRTNNNTPPTLSTAPP